MADTEVKVKPEQTASPLVGAQAVATTLGDTTKIDIDHNKVLIDTLIEAGLSSKLNYSELETFTTISNNRDTIYQLIDTMLQDSAVSSVVKTFAEEATEQADNGHIIWCESSDPKVSRYVNYLLNVMNVDKNIYSWAYSLVAYGDVYLKLFRNSDYEDELFDKTKVDKAFSARNILNENLNKTDLDESVNLNIHYADDAYSYYVEMVPNPGTMFELTRYGKTYGYVETPDMDDINRFDFTTINNMANGQNAPITNYRMKSNDVNVYQADDYVHAFLADGESRYPEKVDLFYTEDDYKNKVNSHAFSVKRGKSMLYDSYKIWREKSLMEAAILLTRLTRSSLIRLIQYEAGDMPKEQVKAVGRRIKELFEQKTALDTNNSLSEYTDPGALINNVYFPTHEGKGSISVTPIGGDFNVKDLVDYDDWVNKFYAAYGIPKAYYGWTQDGAGFNGGTSLSIVSTIFAKGVKRVQNALIQMVSDAISLFLLDRGYKTYINNFVLKMKSPVTQEEKDYREALGNKVNSISNIQSLFGDVEDKCRKLELTKILVSQLEYGDEMAAIIEEEIKATKRAEEEAAEKEAAENENSEESEDLDLDLGNSSAAPMESFNSVSESAELLTEDITEAVIDEDKLPPMEDIDIDFSRNN